MKINSSNKILNATGFQAVWWLIALYKESVIPIVIVLVVLHFIFLNKNFKNEIIFVFLVTLFGIMIDSILMKIGFINFGHSSFYDLPLVPSWLMVLWLAFATTLNQSLSWITNKSQWSLIVGGLGGSLSYIGAANLGTITLLKSNLVSFLILFSIWTLFFFITRFVQSFFKIRFVSI